MREDGVHVVAMPYPLQGHITPMLHLSHLLAARGITVTFVHLQSNFSRLHFSQARHIDDVPPLRMIRHVSLSGSLPGKPAYSLSSARARLLASEELQPSFSLLLARLHVSSKVSCLIADALMSWALPLAAQMGILGASLFTCSLSSLACYCNIPLLASLGVLPIKDMDDTAQQALIKCIPGLPQIFSFADLPTFFKAPSWPDDVLDFTARQAKLMSKATWVLSNTMSLEPEIELEEEMRKMMHIISIGPLLTPHGISGNDKDEDTKSNNYMDDILRNHKDEGTRSSSMDDILLGEHECLHFMSTTPHLGAHTRASLLREDASCLEWLHARPSSSVIYVSFGSVVALSPPQIEEIFLGLEASQHPFLWALRPDAIEHERDGEANSQTSLEFDVMSRTTKLGLLVSWAPQIDVLAHEAIGGFMTHCGWNSVMESIAMGKPMLGFPRFAEQRMNCKLMEHWQVGKELQVGTLGLVERHEVESCVRLLMDGNERNNFRSACAKLRLRTLHAISSKNGTSLKNLDRFVMELLEKTG